MHKLIISLAALFAFVPGFAMAQDAAPAAAAPAADAAAPAAAAPAADAAAPAPAPVQSNEPGDIIAGYFSRMGDIVAENMDNPEALVEKFSAYIKSNEKDMKAASKSFQAKLNKMKSNEAEAYRETVQRKITPPLNKLISLLVDFGNRYPDDAKKLDSMLKVDAKYTYQQ